MNGWASKAISTPDTLNTIYRLAGSWVKTNTMKTENRTAVTFMTFLENPRYHASDGKKNTKRPVEKAQEKN